MKNRMILSLLAAALMLIPVLTSACTPKAEAPELIASDEPGLSETPYDETPDAEATFRRSTLYYISDEGYVVPVTKLIPWEEGIARACLSYMVSTPENVSAAREMGLMTAIPDGVALSLRVADGNALVDMSGLRALSSREEELNMIEAVTNTLIEFPTVNTVTITRDGRGGRLENGAELPIRHEAYPLNPEDPELAVSTGASAATLWFPNVSGAVNVPVTRYLGKTPSVYSVAAALVEGTSKSGLRSCFPEGTLLLGAAIENGTATVNLSDDFKAVTETERLYSLAYRSLYLTLSDEFGITGLRIQVNGVPFEPEEAEPPAYANSFGSR